MQERSIRVQRIYKNSSGEILRIDTVSVSGTVLRTKAFVTGGWTVKKDPVTNHDVLDWGTFKFHSDGRQVGTETFQTTTTRTISEVEMIGGYSSLGSAPNYNSFTWQYGVVDVSDLPQVGDVV